MAKMIQIRHVPDGLHKRLRSRAALAGMTLSDYLRHELEQVAGQLTPGELRARLDKMSPAVVRESSVDIIRRDRDSQ
jgi:plasmid stability protein